MSALWQKKKNVNGDTVSKELEYDISISVLGQLSHTFDH